MQFKYLYDVCIQGNNRKISTFVLLLRDNRAAKHSFLKIFRWKEEAKTDIWKYNISSLIKMRCKIYNFDVLPLFPARILTNNPIIFAQFSSNLNSGMILLLSTIFTGHFRLHLEALWHNLVAILSRQHEMTVVIRQEAKFSFMPEILAANIVVGSSAQGKNCCLGWVG